MLSCHPHSVAHDSVAPVIFILCLSVVCVLFAPIIVGWPRERWEGGWVWEGWGSDEIENDDDGGGGGDGCCCGGGCCLHGLTVYMF